jgi:cytochrome oxidase assembly protein ShyY1
MPPGQASEAGGSRVCLFVHSPRHTAAGSTSLINRGVLPSRQRVLQSQALAALRSRTRADSTIGGGR